MNRITRIGAVAGLVVALVALAIPPEANAQPNRRDQPQEQVAIPGGGTDLFRALLDREGITPVSANELRNMFADDPHLIVIVVGRTNVQWDRDIDPLHWVRRAVRANGGALLASDTRTQLQDSDGNWVGSFNGNEINADARDCHNPNFQRFTDCPYVVPVSPNDMLKGNEKPGRVWAVFRGLNRLATNKPTHIEMNFNGFRNEYRYALARLPKSSFLAWGGGQFNQPPLFAVGNDGPTQPWGPGYSFLAVADSSVYINQMIMEPGTDNLEFTLRTIEYLQGPDKQRNRCAFIENGKVIDKFDDLKQAMKSKAKIPPEKMPNMGPLIERNQDKLVDLGNKLADQVQTRDGLHNMFVGREGTSEERNRFAWWMERVAVVLAIFVSLYLLRRTFWSRQPMDVPPAPATGAGTASTGPPGVFERRQKELVRRNNLYEPVRNLLREFFDSIGAPPDPGPRMPRLVIDHRAVRKPESLRQAVRDMWRIAYGPPMYLSAQRWFEVEPYFERLRQAHEDGKWRFETSEEET